jgi:hypothetical protein
MTLLGGALTGRTNGHSKRSGEKNPTKSIQNQTKSITQKQINNTGICKILDRFCWISAR